MVDLLEYAKARGITPPPSVETPGAVASGGFDLRAYAESRGIEPGVETSPLAEPAPTPEVLDPNLIYIPQQPVSPIISKAAKSGVDFNTPAPDGHFLASLSIDADRRLGAYKTALSRKFGEDVKVRVGPKTGEPEYLNPETKRYTLISPPGSFQAGSLGGAAIVIAPEAAAGIAAALLTRSVPATIAAESGGTFVGEVVRMGLGRYLGANDGVSDDEIILEAAKQAGITAAFAGGGAAAAKTGRFIIDVIEGRAFNRATLADLDLTMDEAQKIADQINARTLAAKMRFTMGQATNDEDLLVQEEFFRKGKSYAKAFRAFDEEQQAALREFHTAINRPYQFPLTSSQHGLRRKTEAEVGGDAMGVAGSAVQRQRDRVDVFVRAKDSELNDAITGIKDHPFEDMGRSARAFGDQEQVAFRDTAKENATRINTLAGNKEFIENKETFQVVSDIDETVKRALFPSIQQPQRGLIGAMGKDGDAVRKVFDPDAKFTFVEAWDAISALKRVERIASKGLSTETPEVAAVGRLIGALERDLKASAQDSPLRDQYDKFIGWYRAEKNRLDKGVVGQIMEREGKNGRFAIADERVFRTMFTKGTEREAKEFRSLISGDPTLMQGSREAVADFYKREVIEGGRVNLNKHAQWVKDYNKAAAVFFTKDEMKTLLRPGGIEKALRARETARETALAQINKSFEADVANLNNPGQLVTMVMDPKDPSKAEAMMRMLEKTPDVKRGVQAMFLKRMSDQTAGLFKGEHRNLSPVKLNDFIEGKAFQGNYKGVIKAMFGDQYLENLETLNSALSVASRRAASSNTSNTGAFLLNTVTGLARAYVGMFTRPGRFITAASRLRSKAAERVMFRAMLNPGDLNELMALSKSGKKDQFAALVSGLGGSILTEDFNE